MSNDDERDYVEETYWRQYCPECDGMSPRCVKYGHADHWRGLSNEKDRLTVEGSWVDYSDHAEQGITISLHSPTTGPTEVDLSNNEFDRLARELGYVRG